MALHASTIFARSPSAISAYLSRLPKNLTNHPLLFTLSSNASQSAMSDLTSSLMSLSSVHNVGCISAPGPSATTQDLIACSLAFFDKDTAVPFRSEIPGRTPTQVGRWHAMRKKPEDVERGKGKEELAPGAEKGLDKNVDWEDVWGRNVGDDELPPDLRTVRKEDVHSVLAFTDNAYQGLFNSLGAFPQATKIGLIGASTPFITGRPYTLIHNKSVYSTGAVGIALTSASKPRCSMVFPGMTAITPKYTVTSSEGNLIHELDNKNPSSLLLNAINQTGLDKEAAKEDSFYLCVLEGDKPREVYNIMSGDPSRGTISLDSDAAPPANTVVQIFHRSKDAPIELPSSFYHPNSQSNTLAFLTCPPDHPASSTDNPTTITDDVQVYPNTFLAGSENGFILNLGNKGNGNGRWSCTVPNGLVSLTWPQRM